ncbi:MAG: hypothetical protein COV75_08085, partial [Candidatus Omnitrophica bacterium CG11_big_fil_rev_8_21_14_0_20_63_9]
MALSSPQVAWASACSATTTGNWGTAGIWTNCNSTTPQSTDTATIAGGATVTLDSSSPTIQSLTLGSTYSGKLIVQSSQTLTVTNSGNTAINITSNGTLQIGESSGNTNGTVTLDHSSGGGITNAGNLTFTGSGTLALNLTGAIVNSGTVTKVSTSTITFNGTTAQTWTDNNATKQDFGVVVINKTNATVSNNKITLGSAVKATSVTIDGTASAEDTLDLSSYTLTLTGSGTPLTRSGTFTSSTGTVEYTSTDGVSALSSAAMT